MNLKFVHDKHWALSYSLERGGDRDSLLIESYGHCFLMTLTVKESAMHPPPCRGELAAERHLHLQMDVVYAKETP